MKTLVSHILAVIVSGILIFCFAGCTQTSILEPQIPEATQSPTADDSTANVEILSNETAAAIKEEPSISPFGEDFGIVITMDGEPAGEYDLDYQVGPILFGTPYSDIVALLGQPERVEKAQYQEYDAKWHMSAVYMSKGISLQLASAEEKGEYLTQEVSVFAPFSGKSAKGIGIGSSEDEVRAAYSDMINMEDSSAKVIVLGGVYWGVHFQLSDEDVVESITFGAGAE